MTLGSRIRKAWEERQLPLGNGPSLDELSSTGCDMRAPSMYTCTAVKPTKRYQNQVFSEGESKPRNPAWLVSISERKKLIVRWQVSAPTKNTHDATLYFSWRRKRSNYIQLLSTYFLRRCATHVFALKNNVEQFDTMKINYSTITEVVIHN